MYGVGDHIRSTLEVILALDVLLMLWLLTRLLKLRAASEKLSAITTVLCTASSILLTLLSGYVIVYLPAHIEDPMLVAIVLAIVNAQMMVNSMLVNRAHRLSNDEVSDGHFISDDGEK